MVRLKIVDDENNLEEMFLIAKARQKIFCNDELYIEKYLKSSSHRFRLSKNRTVHIGERDCSVSEDTKIN